MTGGPDADSEPTFSTAKMPSEAVTWLAERIVDHRVPQRRIAETVGMDPPTLSRALAGARRMKVAEFDAIVDAVNRYCPSPPSPAAHRLLRLRLPRRIVSLRLGISEDRLIEIAMGHGEEPTDRETDLLSGIIPSIRKVADAPASQAARGGEFDIVGLTPVRAPPVPLGAGRYGPLGQVVEWIPTPGKLVNSAGAFAFYVPDDGLSPRYLRGELLYIQPGRYPLPDRWGMLLGEKECVIGRFAVGNGQTGDEGIVSADGVLVRLQKFPGAGLARVAGSWTD